jgi:N utilization substance protein A
MSELGGEKIDIIEWSEDPVTFIEDALSPAQVMHIKVITEPDEENRGHVEVEVSPDQQSLAIGRGGQNVRLAAKLTGWKIDIMSQKTGEELAEADTDGKVNLEADTNNEDGDDIDVLENEDATTTKPDLDEVLNKSEDTADRDVANESEEAEEQTDTPEEAEREVE